MSGEFASRSSLNYQVEPEEIARGGCQRPENPSFSS